MSNEYLNNDYFETTIDCFKAAKCKKNFLTLVAEDRRGTVTRKKKRRAGVKRDLKILDVIEASLVIGCQEFQEVQAALADCFYLLATNIIEHAKFDLIDAEDAIQECVLICFDKIDRFDSRKGKAFNYMTTCVYNHCRQLYRSSKNYNELKRRYQCFKNETSQTLPRSAPARTKHRLRT